MLRLPARFRFRWGIASILTLSMVLVIAALTVTTTVLDIRRHRAIFRHELEERGILRANTLNGVMADPLYFADVDKLNDMAEVVRSEPGIVYLQVFGPNGRLLVESGADDYPVGSIGDLGLAAVRDRQAAIRPGADMLEVAAPIKIGAEVIGAVQLGFSTNPIEAEIRSIATQRIWQSLALMSVGVAIS